MSPVRPEPLAPPAPPHRPLHHLLHRTAHRTAQHRTAQHSAAQRSSAPHDSAPDPRRWWELVAIGFAAASALGGAAADVGMLLGAHALQGSSPPCSPRPPSPSSP